MYIIYQRWTYDSNAYAIYTTYEEEIADLLVAELEERAKRGYSSCLEREYFYEYEDSIHATHVADKADICSLMGWKKLLTEGKK